MGLLVLMCYLHRIPKSFKTNLPFSNEKKVAKWQGYKCFLEEFKNASQEESIIESKRAVFKTRLMYKNNRFSKTDPKTLINESAGSRKNTLLFPKGLVNSKVGLFLPRNGNLPQFTKMKSFK